MALQPTASDLHVVRPLTNVSVAWMQSEKAFVAGRIFPMVPVKHKSDLFWTYNQDYWFRTAAAERAGAVESAGGGYALNAASQYNCKVWAFHHDVSDQERANYDDPLDPDTDGTLFVSRQLMLRREKQFFLNYFKTGIWTGYQSGGSPVDFAPNVNGNGYWDSSSSNPLQDVDTLKSQGEGQTGYIFNKMIVARDIFYALRNHPVILDRIKYTQRGLVTEDLLASLFGVEEFIVASAVQNSAQEGQTASYGFIMQNQMLLCYAPPAPGIRTPSAGYIFTWDGMFGAGAFGTRIKKFRREKLAADRIEGEMAFDMKQVAANLGVLGINVLQHP